MFIHNHNYPSTLVLIICLPDTTIHLSRPVYRVWCSLACYLFINALTGNWTQIRSLEGSCHPIRPSALWCNLSGSFISNFILRSSYFIWTFRTYSRLIKLIRNKNTSVCPRYMTATVLTVGHTNSPIRIWTGVSSSKGLKDWPADYPMGLQEVSDE